MDDIARILVVDDDPLMLRLASRVLREAGHEIVPAASGSEALQLAEEEALDLIILDVVLPDIDGIEICRRIKGNPGSNDAYVILLSGQRTESKNQAAGLEAGADGYITRPVSNRQLLARVEAMLRLKRAEDALRQKTEKLESEIARRRLERESEERRLYLEATLDSAPDAIVTLNRDHEVLEWNQAAEDLFGYSAAEVVGQEIDPLVAGAEGDALEEASGMTERLLDGEAVAQIETVRYRKDGTAVDVKVAGAPIVRNGKVIGVVGIYRDISDRKRYEREIRKRRAYLETVMRAFPAAIVTVDREQRVADWNEAAEELFGYSAAEAAGRELDLLVAGPSQKALQEAHRFTEHVESGVPVSATETVRYRKDGTPVDVILGGAPIIIDDTFVGAFVIYTDITEQVQASDALRRSERKFRSLVEQSRDAIVLTDKEGVVVEWNPAAERIFGLEKGAVLGQALWDVQLEIVPTERRTESLKRRMKIALQETLKTGVGTWINRSHEIEIERPNGERRIVQTVSFTIETDDGFRIGSASRDITEEAHAEERVRFQARLLNAVGQAIIVTEPDGTITYWNHAAEELYGWKEDEVLGRNVTSVTPTEASREQASSIMASLNKGEHWAGQFPVRRRDGTTFPAIVSNTPVQDEDGNLAAIIGITTDITEQKRTEERLRQSEIRFRELFDRMSSGVAIYRPKGDGSAFFIEDINQAGQRISQVDREEVVGREVRDVFPGVVELGLFEVLQDVYRTGRSRHHPVAEYEDEDLSQWVENYVYKLPSDEIVAVYDDVTERQQMEEALRESEGQYRSLYNSIRDAILVADTERTIIDCNPAFSDLFGYTLEEIEGKQTHTVYESREEFEALGEALQGHVGDPNFLFTVHYRKKSGEVFPGETNVFYLRNDEGDVTGFIGLIRDVTERQRMERELRESRERYRTLVENQGEGIAIVTPEDRFIFANPTAHDIFGVARGELVGRGLGGFLDEEGRSLVAAQTERRRAGERSTYEIDIVRPDGERRTLLVTASPRPSDDGRFTGTLAVFRDISERKELEKTLEWEAEANSIIARLLRALLGSASIEEISNIVLRGATDLTDSAFGYVGAIDPETGYLVCPTMTREIWDVCDVEDKSIVFEHFGGLWGWVLENREALLTNEPADAPRSSGTPEGHFPVRRFISAPALIDGELVGQVALANAERDYTERDLELVERLADTHALAIQHLRVEEQLREHRENLEEMVEQRTRELREAQEKLFRNQKLTMLGKLAGSINHELRGPLGNIQSGAYFLDMAIEKPDEDVDETVELIQREVDRAESIVSSLLNFVRTREPQREPVDVNSLIEDLLARAEIPEGIDVFRDTDEDIPTILADPEQLQRVFRNLISNAIEAMPEGGHLTVETAQASEELATPEDQILVSISDTGEGIPEENQEKIFEPLFSTKSEGVGLGLALTHMLVEAHKGTIDLESEEGQGSTFRVTLPVAEGENGDV